MNKYNKTLNAKVWYKYSRFKENIQQNKKNLIMITHHDKVKPKERIIQKNSNKKIKRKSIL